MSLSLLKKKVRVGLDLGHHSIKLVTLDRTASGYRVTRAVSTPMPPEAMKDGVVTDPDAVSFAIRQLLKQCKVSANAAYLSVAGASVVVRTVRIPEMPEATLRKSIKFEAGRYVPNSVEDSFIEFEILGSAGDGQMDVLIVAAPKDIVESRVRAVEAAGLEVEAVDIEPFAAFRSLVEADPSVDPSIDTIALIDIGSSTTNVSVVSKGVFAMTRSIPQGGSTLTEALAKYFKLSPEDAEEGKAQLDLRLLIQDSAPSENPPLRVIQPHVDDLVREMRRSLNYYQSQQTEAGSPSTVTRILLCGGGARLAGLPEYLAHKLGMPVVSCGLFDNTRFLYAGLDEIGNGVELAVASGLALRAFAKAA